MYQVKYDLSDAQTSLEYILEQVIYGAEVIIIRNGFEVARITVMDGQRKNAVPVLNQQPQPYRVAYAS